jgi:hypothetical protein
VALQVWAGTPARWARWREVVHHTFSHTKVLKIVPEVEKVMQLALLILRITGAFATRKNDGTDAYTGAWRVYYALCRYPNVDWPTLGR